MTNTVSQSEARNLLNEANRISKKAHDAVRWPYITFLLLLGVVTSFGSFAMAITDGAGFGLAYTLTLIAFFAIMMVFLISTKGKLAFAWSKRWTFYIAAWTIVYVGAIMVSVFAHGSLVLATIASGLVLILNTTFAIIEMKR